VRWQERRLQEGETIGLVDGEDSAAELGAKSCQQASGVDVLLKQYKLVRAVSGLVFVADGVISTAFLFLAMFLVKLLLGLRQAEGGTGWLSVSAIVGAGVYLVLDLSRFMLSTARGFSPAHHFTAAEAATLFDLGNALTSFTWGAIAMIMVPAAIAAIRTRALPLWLGGAALVIGLANLVWAWLPPGGTATPAEFAFLIWIVVTSLWLVWRPMSAGG
jgi:hypothetical protein